MAAGDFTATDVPRLKLAARSAWADAKANGDDVLYDPTVQVLNAIAQNDTTAFKNELELADNCAGVEIGWVEPNVSVSSSSNYQVHQVVPCEITGPMASSITQTYKLQRMVKATFMIKEAYCKNLANFESIYATQSLAADRALIKQLGVQLLTKIHGYAGVNKVPTVATQGNEFGGANLGTIAAGTPTLTRIPRGNLVWQDFIPYLQLLKQRNKMRAPYLLDGTMFFKALIQAQLETDPAKRTALGLANITADLDTFIDAGMLDKLFMLDRGAVALSFKAVNPDRAEDLPKDMIRYKENVNGLVLPRQGAVQKDVYVSRQTIAVPGQAGDCELYRVFENRIVWDAFKNPTLTGDTGTGILEFQADNTLPTICSPAPYACPPVVA